MNDQGFWYLFHIDKKCKKSITVNQFSQYLECSIYSNLSWVLQDMNLMVKEYAIPDLTTYFYQKRTPHLLFYRVMKISKGSYGALYSSFAPWLRVSFSTFCMISNHKLWSILTIDLRIFLNGQFQVQYRFTSTILSSLNFTKYSLRVIVWEKKTVKSFITIHKSKLLVNNCKQIFRFIFVRDPMPKKNKWFEK